MLKRIRSSQQRVLVALLATFLFGSAIIVFLSMAWYQSMWQGGFHWFDDSAEWLGIDKLGHVAGPFHFSWICYQVFCWSGIRHRLSFYLAISFGWILPSSIEIIDGFVPSYGASWADLIANTIGVLLFAVQIHVGRMVFFPKLSFWYSGLAPLRPAMLGSNWLVQIVKDYSGQTHWWVWDINALIGKRLLPPWLVLCVGYKATGLLGGHDNVWQDDTGHTQDYTHIARAQRWYLSIDLHPKLLHTSHNRLWNALSYPLRWWIKIPAPTLEFGERGLVWHWLYF